MIVSILTMTINISDSNISCNYNRINITNLRIILPLIIKITNNINNITHYRVNISNDSINITYDSINVKLWEAPGLLPLLIEEGIHGGGLATVLVLLLGVVVGVVLHRNHFRDSMKSALCCALTLYYWWLPGTVFLRDPSAWLLVMTSLRHDEMLHSRIHLQRCRRKLMSYIERKLILKYLL